MLYNVRSAFIGISTLATALFIVSLYELSLSFALVFDFSICIRSTEYIACCCSAGEEWSE